MGEKSPCFSAALCWADLKVAGMNAIDTVINALCHSCSGILSPIWILRGLCSSIASCFMTKIDVKWL